MYRISRSSRCQQSGLQKIPLGKPLWWTNEPLTHTNSFLQCKFPPLLHNIIESRSKSDNLESEKKTHNKILNIGALRHSRRGFPHDHERRTWDKRHLKKKGTIDYHKKKQETKTNPRSLQSNPKPLHPTLPGFFKIGILVYKTKGSSGNPPLTNLGFFPSSRWSIHL
jgi:hypothetical protein